LKIENQPFGESLLTTGEIKKMKIFKIIYYLFLGAIALVAILLIASKLPIPGNYQVMTVLSGSMAPAIKMGSVVMVKPVPSTGSGQAEYKIGDVITFGPMGRAKAPTTHRIYDIKITGNGPVYITKGDANNAPDTREVSQREVMGKVLFSVPYLGFAINTARKPLGFALIIIVPALIFVSDETRNIISEIKAIRNKKAANSAEVAKENKTA